MTLKKTILCNDVLVQQRKKENWKWHIKMMANISHKEIYLWL